MKNRKKKEIVPPVDNCLCPWCGSPLRMVGICDAGRDFNPYDENGNYLEAEDTEYCTFVESGYACTKAGCGYEFTTEKAKKDFLYMLYKMMRGAEELPVLPDSAAPEVY